MKFIKTDDALRLARWRKATGSSTPSGGKTHIMTIRTVTHAPDGGMFDHALCEEPTGDTVLSEAEVTCTDCAYKVEQADQILVARLKRRGFRFDGN